MIVGGAKLSAKAIRGAGHQVAKLSTQKEATDAQIANTSTDIGSRSAALSRF